MTQPPTPSCDSSWEPSWEPTDRPPTGFDLRQAEMIDLYGQGPGRLALWTAITIHAEEYL